MTQVLPADPSAKVAAGRSPGARCRRPRFAGGSVDDTAGFGQRLRQRRDVRGASGVRRRLHRAVMAHDGTTGRCQRRAAAMRAAGMRGHQRLAKAAVQRIDEQPDVVSAAEPVRTHTGYCSRTVSGLTSLRFGRPVPLS